MVIDGSYRGGVLGSIQLNALQKSQIHTNFYGTRFSEIAFGYIEIIKPV